VLDAFELLRLPRRPLLDEAQIRAAFQRRAAEVHPDVAGGGESDFAELTKAHETLRDPALRLRHLLELEGAVGTSTAIPAELAVLFPRVAQARQRIDAFLAKRAEARGGIARALLAGEGATVRKEAEETAQALGAEYVRAVRDLQLADAAWPEMSGLVALQGRFAFLGKWSSQLREALLRLEIE
jgi:curved DNA-binding protein CbpA